MGFRWDEYNAAKAELESKPFLTQQEKARLVGTGETFEITAVRHGNVKTGKYPGDRWFVDVELSDGKHGTLSFRTPSFERRDALLSGMSEHFANGSQRIATKLVMWGNAYGLEPA